MIETGNTEGNYIFSLYSLDGKLADEKYLTGAKSSIRVNQLSDGLYLYQLRDISTGNVIYNKLQIQH
jgi:hypothetical protein